MPIEEVFALQVLPGIRFPEVVVDDPRIGDSFILPTQELKGTPVRWRTQSGPQQHPRRPQPDEAAIVSKPDDAGAAGLK